MKINFLNYVLLFSIIYNKSVDNKDLRINILHDSEKSYEKIISILLKNNYSCENIYKVVNDALSFLSINYKNLEIPDNKNCGEHLYEELIDQNIIVAIARHAVIREFVLKCPDIKQNEEQELAKIKKFYDKEITDYLKNLVNYKPIY